MIPVATSKTINVTTFQLHGGNVYKGLPWYWKSINMHSLWVRVVWEKHSLVVGHWVLMQISQSLVEIEN